MMNSRRLMASPAPRTTSGMKNNITFWIRNCAVRYTPCPLRVISGHRGTSARRPFYPRKWTFTPQATGRSESFNWKFSPALFGCDTWHNFYFTKWYRRQRVGWSKCDTFN
jgi:hypothetical protein